MYFTCTTFCIPEARWRVVNGGGWGGGGIAKSCLYGRDNKKSIEETLVQPILDKEKDWFREEK